jgi:hypothetical protein
MTQSETRTARPASAAPSSGRSLRSTSLAVTVAILLEYFLGMWVSLYATLPKSDAGKSTFAAFGASVADGPAMLAAHAVLGTLILLGALSLVIRAALVRAWVTAVLSLIGLVAVLGAWMAGTKFVGSPMSSASFVMATTTAIALLCYVIILFLPPRGAGSR